MRRSSVSCSVLSLFALGVIGCLDPLSSDEIDLDRIFGDPTVEPTQAAHVEDNADLRKNLEFFPTEVPYLKAFSEGQPIWYWHVPPPSTDFIVPFYVVVLPDGSLQRPIIDVIPGDGGYSPWWRRYYVRTTPKYNGERIWSRAAVDAGVKMGILDPPEETTSVVTCPVVRRNIFITVDAMTDARVPPTWVWYRNQRVSWVEFKSDIEVPLGVREMPTAPLFVLQRVNQVTPLFEYAIKLDLDGDGLLRSSNNIFRSKNGSPGYTPLWYNVGVRTVAEYVSFDTVTASTTIGLKDEREFVGPDYAVVVSPLVVPPLDVQRQALQNCPIQQTRGEL